MTKSKTKSKHSWNWLEDYLRVHERVLGNYTSDIETPRSYSYTWLTEQYLILSVTFHLKTSKGQRVRIDISKDVEVEALPGGKRHARTEAYSYNASIGSGNLIRYDSPHDQNENTPDHHKFHHNHDFTKTPPTIARVHDDWPHVNEFLDEVLQRF